MPSRVTSFGLVLIRCVLEGVRMRNWICTLKDFRFMKRRLNKQRKKRGKKGDGTIVAAHYLRVPIGGVESVAVKVRLLEKNCSCGFYGRRPKRMER